MYTNIDTDNCIERLSNLLRLAACKAAFPHVVVEALIEALVLVMKNNRMKFGDLFVLQLIGIAMGMSPAPTISNLYVALHEIAEVLPWLQRNLFWLCRFIDDGFGIWIPHPNAALDAQLWATFQAAVNNGGLTWEFTERSSQVDFMDVTITLVGTKLETNLFEKKMALHLYLPPHSRAMSCASSPCAPSRQTRTHT
ncbi:hypothetical protein ACHAWF_005469 [Thalassiosira exigua]